MEPACGGLFGSGSCGATIEFGDARYNGMGAADLEIDEGDIEQIGTVDKLNSTVASDEVFALDGVDPAMIVVMRAAAGSDSEYILYTRGELEYTAAFCSYFRDPPSECS